jgi:hypothetical protein
MTQKSENVQPKDISGRWNLIEIEYPSVEPGADDGGFADEGMGSSMDADSLGLGSAFLELGPKGELESKYWGDEKGSWRVEDGRPVLTIHGNDIELKLRDGLLERPDFDEEHGRAMIVRYESAKAQKEAKLTKKTQKLIDGVWNVICDCDHIMEKDLEKAFEQGGQAAANYMQGFESDVWILTAAIGNRDWPLATRLIERGVPLVYEFENESLADYAAEEAGYQKDPEKRAAGEAVATLIREKSGG